MTDYYVQYWSWVETWVPKHIILPTCCLSELRRLSYLIWKRRIRVTCWSKIQHYCPTDRYFMMIFDVHLGSTDMAQYFGLSPCSPLKDIKLPYTRWKGTSIASIWGTFAWSAPRGYRDMAPFLLQMTPASYSMDLGVYKNVTFIEIYRSLNFSLKMQGWQVTMV